MPAIAPQPVQKHAALIWLIRGTGAFIAGASVIIGCLVLGSIVFDAFRVHPWYFMGILALLLLALGLYGIRPTRVVMAIIFAIIACYFFGCLLVTTLHGQPQSSVNFGWFGAPLSVLGALGILWLLGVVFYLFVKRGYEIWRRVDKITVADFASVFALFVARVFHYFLPAHLPKAINDHVWLIFRNPGDRGGRSMWTLLVLYLSYKLIKASLLQVLELNPPNPPENTDSSEDDIPEFPQKSPLIPL